MKNKGQAPDGILPYFIMQEKTVIELRRQSDVSKVSRFVSEVASEMGFDKLACAEVALAASEICQNAVKYGEKGTATIRILNSGKILQIVVEDSGTGIPNIQEAVKEGFTTSNMSLGLGLKVAQRSVDGFTIESDKGNGAKVTMKKFLPLSHDEIGYGVVSIPEKRYNMNGDQYLIKEFEGDKVLLAVFDGSGQGMKAYFVASVVIWFLENNYYKPLEKLCEELHVFLKQYSNNRGGAISLALLEKEKISYIGIGDTHAYLTGAENFCLSNNEGIIGEYQLPTLKVSSHKMTGNELLVICTDGLKSGILRENINCELSAQNIANSLFNRYVKEYGDATVLVVKKK
ncbi:MAG: ATP-binding protein [Bacteroidetes bacterium]|nr:ATP-binding protein [Bacteroidota bacterium]